MKSGFFTILLSLLITSALFGADHFIEDRTDVVPAYLWTCGCTPTAGTMVVGYYDWLSPTGRFVFYGRLVNHYFVRRIVQHLGHLESRYYDRDSEPYHASSGQYDLTIPYANYQLAWGMHTDGPSGETVSFPWDERIKDGLNYWTDECSGYGFWTDEDYTIWNMAYIFHMIQDEIDAWRPCIWSHDGEWHNGIIGGHSVAAIGYGDDGYVHYLSTWELEYHSVHHENPHYYANCAIAHSGGECYEGDIELFVPDGGEEWGGGSYHNITWYQWPDFWGGENKIDLVKIYWTSDSGYSWNYITQVNTANAGWHNYSWCVPNVDNEYILVKVEAWVDRGGGNYDLIASESSEFKFSIYSRTITVISPNGSETWLVGNTYNITWTSYNMPPSENVRIQLYKGGNYVCDIVSSTPNDGSHSWQIPTTLSSGYNYKIKIFIADSPVIHDFSDNNFSIQWLYAPSNLRIITQPTPNSITIEWQDNSGNEVGFQIGRKVDGGAWNENYATVGANVTQFTDDVEFLYNYTYKVRAFDGATPRHYSDWSNELPFTHGMLAHSVSSTMSAFNGQCKILQDAAGTIHVLYHCINEFDESRMYYSYSTDGGMNFNPWQEVAGVDTIPALSIDDNGTLWAVGATSHLVGGPTKVLEYYLFKQEGQTWTQSYDEVFRKDIPYSGYEPPDDVLHPASFVIGGIRGISHFGR